MSDPVNDAIAAAQAAAAAAVETTSAENLPATAGAPAAAPAAYVPRRAPTMSDVLASANLRPDAWLKVSEHGLLIGTAKDLIETIVCDIDMTEQRGFYLKEAIKFGNPAVYLSSYDGVTCDKGGTWEAAIAKAQAIDQKAKPYYSADIKMTIVDQVKNTKGKKVDIGAAGKTLGLSTSTTNMDEWREFYRECAEQDLIGKTVRCVMSAKPLENNAGNTWGVVVWSLVGAAPA